MFFGFVAVKRKYDLELIFRWPQVQLDAMSQQTLVSLVGRSPLRTTILTRKVLTLEYRWKVPLAISCTLLFAFLPGGNTLFVACYRGVFAGVSAVGCPSFCEAISILIMLRFRNIIHWPVDILLCLLFYLVEESIWSWYLLLCVRQKCNNSRWSSKLRTFAVHTQL